MKTLFHNLVWPAAAGNVAWGFFSVAISESWVEPNVGARLVLLLILAAYLASDWLATEKEFHRLKPHYWIGDAFHVPTVVVLAIATQLNTSWLVYCLGAVFVVALLCHLSRVWEPAGEISKPWRRGIPLSLINIVGLVILTAGEVLLSDGAIWHLPIAFGVALALFATLRSRIYEQTK